MSRVHPVFGSRIVSEWELLTINDIKSPEPSSCVAGPFGSNISSKYFVSSGVPVIRGSNLRDDLTRFVDSGFVFVSEDRAQSYVPQHVRGNDLVFTCWGTVGQVGIIPVGGSCDRYIISNKQLKLRVDSERVDPVYVFYYMASPPVVEYVRGRAVGSAVPGISLGILKSIPVVLPPLTTQRRIASALSAYDDLIENNTKRIRVLEEMARAVYREWFESSVNACVWPVQKVSSVASIQRGRSYKGVELVGEGGVPFVNLKCIDRDGGFRRSGVKRFLGDCKPVHHVLPGDIVVAVTDMTQDRRIVARAGRVPRLGDIHGVFSMDLVRVDSIDPLDRSWLYGFLRFSGMADEVKQHANGANVLHLHPSRLMEYECRMPPAELRARYGAFSEPLWECCESLADKNERLRAARDLLLPKLLSGELSVDRIPDPAEG